MTIAPPPSPRDEKQGLSPVLRREGDDSSTEETVAEIDEMKRQLAEALERTPLPAEPDRAAVDRFLVDAYRPGWGW